MNNWFDKDPNRAPRNENALQFKTRWQVSPWSSGSRYFDLSFGFLFSGKGTFYFRRITQDDRALLPGIWVSVDGACDFGCSHLLEVEMKVIKGLWKGVFWELWERTVLQWLFWDGAGPEREEIPKRMLGKLNLFMKLGWSRGWRGSLQIELPVMFHSKPHVQS